MKQGTYLRILPTQKWGTESIDGPIHVKICSTMDRNKHRSEESRGCRNIGTLALH
jgi:hypothetical protein